MPFTLAHPAITLPFTRSRLISTTAIVIGSMIPDVEYFITMGEDCHNSHTWQLALCAYLPLTCIIAYIFHSFIRRDLIRNLPRHVQKRMSGLNNFNFLRSVRQSPLVFLSSAILGIASHFLWDSLTHRHTPITEPFDTFYSMSIAIHGVEHSMQMYLQYISSVFGLCIMIGYMLSFKASIRGMVTRPLSTYWLSVFSLVAAILLLRGSVAEDGLNIREWIISFTTASFISLMITGLFMKYSRIAVDVIAPMAGLDQIHDVLQNKILPLQERILSVQLPSIQHTRKLAVQPAVRQPAS
jgi:hypothetical protein